MTWAPISEPLVTPGGDEVLLVSTGKMSSELARAQDDGLLPVVLPELGPAMRGRLADAIENAVEQALQERQSCPPGVAASSDLDASLSDQLYRARLLGATGLAIAMGPLEGLANLAGALDAEDSAVLRWWIGETAERPVRLLLDEGDRYLSVYGPPVHLQGLIRNGRKPGTAPVDNLETSFSGRSALGAPAPNAEGAVRSDHRPAAKRNSTDDGARRDLDSDLCHLAEVMASLFKWPPPSDPTGPVGSAADPQVSFDFRVSGGATHAPAPSPDPNEDVDAGCEPDEPEAVAGPGSEPPLGSEAPPHAHLAASEPQDEARSIEAPGSAEDGAPAGREALCLEHEQDGRVPLPEAGDEPAPCIESDGPTQPLSVPPEWMRRADARDADEPPETPPAAIDHRAPCEATDSACTASPVTLIHADAEQKWRSWMAELDDARGPKGLGTVERMFVSSYLPLAEAVAAKVAGEEARDVLGRWASSFAKSYTDAYDALALRHRRPTMVLDVPDLGMRIARLHGARAVQLLLVDGMRFDLGLRVHEHLKPLVGQRAVLTERLLLWAAVPSTTAVQLELLARGPDAMRRSDHVAEPELPVARGRAAATPRRVKVGFRELLKLDLVEAGLTETGAPALDRLDALAGETAEVVANHFLRLPQRTLVMLFGDHGFLLDETRTGTSRARQGGASPEEVLVPAFAWLVGNVH